MFYSSKSIYFKNIASPKRIKKEPNCVPNYVKTLGGGDCPFHAFFPTGFCPKIEEKREAVSKKISELFYENSDKGELCRVYVYNFFNTLVKEGIAFLSIEIQTPFLDDRCQLIKKGECHAFEKILNSMSTYKLQLKNELSSKLLFDGDDEKFNEELRTFLKASETDPHATFCTKTKDELSTSENYKHYNLDLTTLFKSLKTISENRLVALLLYFSTRGTYLYKEELPLVSLALHELELDEISKRRNHPQLKNLKSRTLTDPKFSPQGDPNFELVYQMGHEFVRERFMPSSTENLFDDVILLNLGLNYPTLITENPLFDRDKVLRFFGREPAKPRYILQTPNPAHYSHMTGFQADPSSPNTDTHVKRFLTPLNNPKKRKTARRKPPPQRPSPLNPEAKKPQAPQPTSFDLLLQNNAQKEAFDVNNNKYILSKLENVISSYSTFLEHVNNKFDNKYDVEENITKNALFQPELFDNFEFHTSESPFKNTDFPKRAVQTQSAINIKLEDTVAYKIFTTINAIVNLLKTNTAPPLYDNLQSLKESMEQALKDDIDLLSQHCVLYQRITSLISNIGENKTAEAISDIWDILNNDYDDQQERANSLASNCYSNSRASGAPNTLGIPSSPTASSNASNQGSFGGIDLNLLLGLPPRDQGKRPVQNGQNTLGGNGFSTASSYASHSSSSQDPYNLLGIFDENGPSDALSNSSPTPYQSAPSSLHRSQIAEPSNLLAIFDEEDSSTASSNASHSSPMPTQSFPGSDSMSDEQLQKLLNSGFFK